MACHMLVSKVSRLQLEKTGLKDSKAHCLRRQSVVAAAVVAVVVVAEQLSNVAPVSSDRPVWHLLGTARKILY